MVLATWRLRKLREENEQKLKAVEEAAKEAVQEAVNESLEKGREQGREEGRRRWQAWARRGEEARVAGLPFDEPPPSERG